MESPSVNVGILTERAISFVFNEEYVNTTNGEFLEGEQRALFINGKIIFNGKLYEDLIFEPFQYKIASFELKAVTIGRNFHWQRQEDQRFKGSLHLLAGKDGIIIINRLRVEDYLTSVISSEMNARASKALLKAHAVISRSWLLAQIEKNRTISASKTHYQTSMHTENELVRWYDREDHTLFDVCADDHCQRYQGISRASTPAVNEAIEETYGEILTYNHTICDARFSKCCGGMTEEFQYCWEPVYHFYLSKTRDLETGNIPDLTQEKEAGEWIRSNPESFCKTDDPHILEQVLNNYDRETPDFYRWKVSYTQAQLAELIARKTGMMFGEILDLIPLERGTSGRISRLQIIGKRRSYIIGKELEIRRILSESHLYSSAFVIDREDIVYDVPQRFIFTGAGWGHGVGLCQIGAAVMGNKGYSYDQILNHYFPGAVIEKSY
ncbi:SpoIID/LytB domain-containing protein [Parabacteroides pacaensis]|uniref:SpoIID/LytB domain-containing protein n=1 Tax=Parabacteroides pacaensis TaxID=2086575 RepID=UPI000D0F1240|nr:SpoIID/LytB domain-containing protein [Parabacteroides pacaensis]